MSERTQAWLLLLAAIAMVLSPIDLMPDAVPVAGNVDDLMAMYVAMSKFIRTRQPG